MWQKDADRTNSNCRLNMNKKMLVTLGVTGFILANVGFSFATSSKLLSTKKEIFLTYFPYFINLFFA